MRGMLSDSIEVRAGLRARAMFAPCFAGYTGAQDLGSPSGRWNTALGYGHCLSTVNSPPARGGNLMEGLDHLS